jgi:hypothetical protein
MTGNRGRLGEKVGDVAKAADEHDTKMSLANPVPDPMQAHVGGLGHPLRHRVGSNADGDLVVAEQRGGGLGVAHVDQDFSFLCRDAGSGVQASVLRLRDKGAHNRDAGGVAGDGVVYPVIVVGEPEIAQATGDAACVGAGEEGGVALIGRVATYPTLGKFSDRRDVRPRILADVEGGPWWRGWGRPARMRGRRWQGGSCRLRICRSTAGIPPPPVVPWPVQGWLRGRGQAQ